MIDFDHIDWLGDTREKIGLEKAGIMRPNRPCVCGDFSPPESILNAIIFSVSLVSARHRV